MRRRRRTPELLPRRLRAAGSLRRRRRPSPRGLRTVHPCTAAAAACDLRPALHALHHRSSAPARAVAAVVPPCARAASPALAGAPAGTGEGEDFFLDSTFQDIYSTFFIYWFNIYKVLIQLF